MIPEDTKAWARDSTQRIYETVHTEGDGGSLIEAAYEGLAHSYGFLEALLSDNYFPWPHEFNKVICYTQMLANAVVMEEMGFDIKIHEFYGFRKEDQASAADHSLITIRDDDDLVFDSQYSLLGPIREWDEKFFTAYNQKKGHEETYRYVCRLDYDLEEYAERYGNLRDCKEAEALMSGQKLGVLSVDDWKIEHPLKVEWFIRYDKDDSFFSTLVGIERPIVQNRGLEMRVQLDENNDIRSKDLFGYYVGSFAWAEFRNKIPMFQLSMEDAMELLPEIGSESLQEQLDLEQRMMDGGVSSRMKHAVQRSYDTSLSTKDAKAVEMITAVEALYQHARHGEFIYNTSVHNNVMKRLKSSDDFVRALYHIQTNIKRKKDLEKMIRNGQKEVVRGRYRCILDTDRIPSAEEREASMLDDPLVRAVYLTGKNPYFTHEACDRYRFVEHKLAYVKHSHEALLGYAKENLPDFESDMLKGYARIFAEFMGHVRNAALLLDTTLFEDNVVRRIKEYSDQSAV